MSTEKMSSLKNLRHIVSLSSGYVDSDSVTDLVLIRTEAKKVFASITPVRGGFYINGIATQESRNSYSHYIVMRYNRNMDISGYAWAFEDRPSGLRWYKIISVQELNERQRFWQLCARLVQKSEDAEKPISNLAETIKLPAGASL